MKKSSKVFLLLSAASMIVFAVSLYAGRETIKGYLRQKKDEEAAKKYLNHYSAVLAKETDGTEDIRSIEDGKSETGTGSETGCSEDPEPEGIVDENYYERNGVTYTPDFARGKLACVLEIPSISLKRGVYSGSQEEIEHDLDIWLTTAASPFLRVGETHYAIYGHNHLVQDLSFNRLKDVKPGDVFTLTSEKKVYSYRVTSIFAEWRSVGRKKYATNLDLDPSLCYIFTCGRDHWLLHGKSTRYKDYLIEGTLFDHDEENEKAGIDHQLVKMEPLLLPAKLEIIENGMTADGLLLIAALKDENGAFLTGATLSLLDTDGNEITSWTQGTRPKQLVLPEGTYVAAVTELGDSFHEEPDGVEITVRKTESWIVRIGEETEEKPVSNSEIIITTAISSAILAVVFTVLFFGSVICGKQREKEKGFKEKT